MMLERDVNPIVLFADWLEEAEGKEPADPNAMSLATVDEYGAPHVRTVLLKKFSEDGFVFFTNFTSAKAQNMAQNPSVALLFYWKSLARQVRITGKVHQISAQESDAYFATRPRMSQIGAWASHQSSSLAHPDVFLEALEEQEKTFKDIPVIPRPDFWGGYCCVPDRIEFWLGRDFRLHDRLLFTKGNHGEWETSYLYP